MKTLKLAVLALMLGASVVMYAKPKKKVKTPNAPTQTSKPIDRILRLNCTIEKGGTVKNANGEVIGTLNSKYEVVNAAGQVIGSIEKTSAEKIGEVYFGGSE